MDVTGVVIEESLERDLCWSSPWLAPLTGINS
jgi:hypothetical protein